MTQEKLETILGVDLAARLNAFIVYCGAQGVEFTPKQILQSAATGFLDAAEFEI